MSPRPIPSPNALAELAANLELIEDLRARLLGGVEGQLTSVVVQLTQVNSELRQIEARLKNVEANASSTSTPQPRSAWAQVADSLSWRMVALILGALAIVLMTLTGRTAAVEELAQAIAAEVARQTRAPIVPAGAP